MSRVNATSSVMTEISTCASPQDPPGRTASLLKPHPAQVAILQSRTHIEPRMDVKASDKRLSDVFPERQPFDQVHFGQRRAEHS